MILISKIKPFVKIVKINYELNKASMNIQTSANTIQWIEKY